MSETEPLERGGNYLGLVLFCDKCNLHVSYMYMCMYTYMHVDVNGIEIKTHNECAQTCANDCKDDAVWD